MQNRSLTRLGGMIAALQNGFSKKSGKPYSMVTLEDLEGTVQVLCMNENYDNYRELLVQGNAIFVIGEVNTGDERPKIFPQEILKLDDVPRRFTKQVHFRLNTAHLTPGSLESIHELVAAYAGKCPLFLCFVRPTGEIIFMETHERFFVTPSRQLQEAADKLFGEQTYYAKVDSSLPERAPRRWERKPEYATADA
jgi:DNA polymerase-3 subunit alpha